MKQMDYIKANRKGSRQAELEDEQGWVQRQKVHKSNKDYSRKVKHKNNEFKQGNFSR